MKNHRWVIQTLNDKGESMMYWCYSRLSGVGSYKDYVRGGLAAVQLSYLTWRGPEGHEIPNSRQLKLYIRPGAERLVVENWWGVAADEGLVDVMKYHKKPPHYRLVKGSYKGVAERPPLCFAIKETDIG